MVRSWMDSLSAKTNIMTAFAGSNSLVVCPRKVYGTGEWGLWNRSPSNFGWPEPEPKIFWMMEAKPEIWVSVQAIYASNAMFFIFFGPNCSGAGAKNLRCWSRSLKFEYRPHSPGWMQRRENVNKRNNLHEIVLST